MARNNNKPDVYKGRRKKLNVLGIVLSAVAVLIVALFVLFGAFQKYIVYSNNGISLELPILATPGAEEEEGERVFEQVNAELEITDPEQVERLLIALSNDVSRETFAEYVSADKKVVAQVQLLSVQRERYSKEPLTRDFYGDYTIDVTEEYVNTLAALEKLGAGDLLTPAPQEISGAVVIPGWSYTGMNYDAESNFYQSVWTSAADRESYLASEDGQEYVQYLSQEEASRLTEAAGYIQPMEDEIFLNIMFLDSESKPGAPLLITSQAMRQAGLEQQAEILERW